MFVLADTDTASEMVFWTRVAERVVQLITAYTGEGNVVFAVDTPRLRPNGVAAGPLVQNRDRREGLFPARTAGRRGKGSRI